MTIDQMRTALGLESDVSDADVQSAYDRLQADWQATPAETVAIIGLADVKTHLRLGSSEAEDDYLNAMIEAAYRSIENATGREISGDAATLDARDMKVVGQASLMLIGHWYANREAVAEQAAEMPLAVRFLIDPLRRFVV